MSQYFASAFRRRPNEGWFQVRGRSLTTTDLICATAVATMFLYGILGGSAWSNLVFSPRAVHSDFEVWRLATWSTATQPDVWPLLGIVFFWMIGQDLEAMMGRNRFFTWFAVVTIVPAAIMTVIGLLLRNLGATTEADGLQIAFLGAIWVLAATYPQARWFDVVPLWAIAAVFTLLDVLRYSGVGAYGTVIFVLLSSAVALSTARSFGAATGWNIPHLPLSPATGRPSGGRRRSHPAQRRRPRSSEKVVKGPWAAPATSSTTPSDSFADQAELDALLDKISDGGLESLTDGEKRRLNELSRKLR